MFEDLEKGWTEEDKYNDFARDRIKRQLFKLGLALLFVLGTILWFYFHGRFRF